MRDCGWRAPAEFVTEETGRLQVKAVTNDFIDCILPKGVQKYLVINVAATTTKRSVVTHGATSALCTIPIDPREDRRHRNSVPASASSHRTLHRVHPAPHAASRAVEDHRHRERGATMQYPPRSAVPGTLLCSMGPPTRCCGRPTKGAILTVTAPAYARDKQPGSLQRRIQPALIQLGCSAA